MGGVQEENSENVGKKQSATVSGNCPAFAEGCPYAQNDDVVEWIKEKRSDGLSTCPAFKDGCPFNEVDGMDGLRKQLEALPPSHAGVIAETDDQSEKLGKNKKAHATLLEMLKKVHVASQSVKKTVGLDCPVFEKACPFKNCVTSSGTPLALELETRSWGLWVSLASEAEASEDVKMLLEEHAERLSKKMKEGTQEAHQAAETVHFMREFVKGRVSRELYAKLVVNLYHIYVALEDGLEANAEHPLIESLHFPDELCRVETLRQDADFFLGPNWEKETIPSKAAKEYIARLKEVASNSPELLVPHAYTRYLGDLSGGQLLKRAAIRGMKLPDDGSGVRFFMFKRIPDAKVFKNMYRARMDNLPADSATADRMVVEANYAFYLNTRMFQELDSLAGFDAEPIPPPTAVPASLGAAEQAEAAALAAAAGCPFAALAASGIAMPSDHPGDKGSKKAEQPPALTVENCKENQPSNSYAQLWIVLSAIVMLMLALFFANR